jgi:hypothetical protein
MTHCTPCAAIVGNATPPRKQAGGAALSEEAPR